MGSQFTKILFNTCACATMCRAAPDDHEAEIVAEEMFPPEEYDVDKDDVKDANEQFGAQANDQEEADDDCHDDHGDPIPPYVEETLQFINNPPAGGCGVHLVIASLAEVNVRHLRPSQWLRRFITGLTTRFPKVPNVHEYLEAQLFPGHCTFYFLHRNPSE